MTIPNFLPNYPSKTVAEYGEEVAAALFDAHIQKCMGGNHLGGCKSFSLTNFKSELHPYISLYLDNGAKDSMAIVYAAMKTKELLT